MITKEFFGKTQDGREVNRFTLTNGVITLKVLDYGATIQSILVPDKNGNILDVCLGYDNVADYENNSGYLGASIGRCANRIAEGKFILNGKEYKLFTNNKPNHLHGGKIGFNKKSWNASVNGEKLVMTLNSPDGEENYDGNLDVSVEFFVDDKNGINLCYKAKTDKPTLCNLTNHVYFNLNGEESGDVFDTQLKFTDSKFAPIDNKLIPTGELVATQGTVFDFSDYRKIGERIKNDDAQLKIAGGYDHALYFEKNGFKRVIEGYSEKSGVTIAMETNQESVQFYSGNFLEGAIGKTGKAYFKNYGFCLEAQYLPNAINTSGFTKPILNPGELYESSIRYEFGKK